MLIGLKLALQRLRNVLVCKYLKVSVKLLHEALKKICDNIACKSWVGSRGLDS